MLCMVWLFACVGELSIFIDKIKWKRTWNGCCQNIVARVREYCCTANMQFRKFTHSAVCVYYFQRMLHIHFFYRIFWAFSYDSRFRAVHRFAHTKGIPSDLKQLFIVFDFFSWILTKIKKNATPLFYTLFYFRCHFLLFGIWINCTCDEHLNCVFVLSHFCLIYFMHN